MKVIDPVDATDPALEEDVLEEAPAEAPESLQLNMIEPPPRGDGPAEKCLWLGLAFYIGFAALFVTSLLSGRPDKGRALLELFGISDGVNLIILLLIVSGIILTAWAAWTVHRDIGLLKREEDDVAWVLRRKRDGLMLVFAPAGEREARFAQRERNLRPGETARVETLVDDRVRRVLQASKADRGRHMPVEELRGIAETRTASFGHVARFASSLLLLLAVLGTFAGVKTALPSLIDAIGATEGAGGGSIVGPLHAVADAFGGNALALVGAIAVGLMAQGLAVGRRSLLERLELASAEYIYENRRTQSDDPLIAAVETLSATAGEVHNASTAFLGIEGSLETLGESFKTAFASLNDKLSDVMRQQDEMLHQKTSQALEELQGRVVALAGAVDANTRAYQGLVDRVGERAAEAREAMQQMQSASEMLSRGIQGILQLGTVSATASTRLEEGIGALVQGTERMEERMTAVADAVERARPAMQEVEAAVAGAADRLATLDARAAASWKNVADEVRKEFEDLARVHAATLPATTGGGSALPSDAVGLLRRIASAVETPPQTTPRELAGAAMVGVLGAAAVVYVVANLGGWVASLLIALRLL